MTLMLSGSLSDSPATATMPGNNWHILISLVYSLSPNTTFNELGGRASLALALANASAQFRATISFSEFFIAVVSSVHCGSQELVVLDPI